MATKSKTRSSSKGKAGGGTTKVASARSSSSKSARSVTKSARGVTKAAKGMMSSRASSSRSDQTAGIPRKAPGSSRVSGKASKAGAKVSAGASRTSSSGTKKEAGRRRVNPEFMKPMQIKEPLTRIVGSEPLPRTEVTKRVWDYIKQHKLQDQENRRQINADENLRELFGRDSVTMFEMTKIINQYLG